MILRPVVEADLERFYDDQADPESARLAAVESRDRPEFLMHWRQLMTDDSTLVRAIDVDGDVVGYVATFVRDGVRELGYRIARQHWGKGIAGSAVASFLADQELRRPLGATVARHNEPSRRILERCGFVQTGVERLQLPDGEEIDLLRFALGD